MNRRWSEKAQDLVAAVLRGDAKAPKSGPEVRQVLRAMHKVRSDGSTLTKTSPEMRKAANKRRSRVAKAARKANR